MSPAGEIATIVMITILGLGVMAWPLVWFWIAAEQRRRNILTGIKPEDGETEP